MSKNNSGVNMTVGSPMKVLFKFWVPVFLGNVLQQIYSVVDAAIVGQCVGSDALAAVGSTAGITFVIFGVIWGITSGFSVITSQLFGEGDMKGVKRSTGNAIVLSAAITLAMMLVLILCMEPLLKLVNTQAGLWDYTLDYLNILVYGLMATLIYNLASSILRAIGDSVMPLVFLVISSVLNIGLDFLFIVPFGMKVAGAAIATVISQAISGILCVIYIFAKVPVLHPDKDDWALDKKIAKDELSVGLPMALQYAVTGVGITILQASLNLMSELTVAAYSAGYKIEMFLEQGTTALGTAMATYTGQNTGAGRYDRIKKGVAAANIMSLIYALTAGLGVAFFGKYLTGIFVSDNLEVITSQVDLFMKIVGFTIIIHGVLLVYRNTVQGMGYGKLSIIGGVIELFARSAVAYLAAVYSSFAIICSGYTVAWIAAGLFFFIMYQILIRVRVRKAAEENDKAC